MARQLIITEFLSLDGVMEAPGGGDHPHAGWTFQGIEFLPEAYELKGREQQQASAILLGRVTFEEFAPVWPSMDDQFPLYNAMPKYVVSTTLSDADVEGVAWKNCHRLDSIEAVRALKEGRIPAAPGAAPAGAATATGSGSEAAADEGPIIVHGSATLAQSLAAAGLVDRYHLVTFPVVLGEGKRLFASDGDCHQRLRLVEDKAFGNGVRMSIYDVVRDEAEVVAPHPMA